MVALRNCPECGGDHDCPEYFLVDKYALDGYMVVCPVTTRYFPLRNLKSNQYLGFKEVENCG